MAITQLFKEAKKMSQNSRIIRTFKKITAVITLAALFIILLLACGNDDGGNGVTPSPDQGGG